MVALANLERGNELGFGVNRAERPDIAKRRIVVNLAVFFLLADESPKLIKLQVNCTLNRAFSRPEARRNLARREGLDPR